MKRLLPGLLALLALGALAGALWWFAGQQNRPVAERPIALPANLPRPVGGQPPCVLVLCWTRQTCPPCVEELEGLLELGNEGFVLVAARPGQEQKEGGALGGVFLPTLSFADLGPWRPVCVPTVLVCTAVGRVLASFPVYHAVEEAKGLIRGLSSRLQALLIEDFQTLAKHG